MNTEREYMKDFVSTFDPQISLLMIPGAIVSYLLAINEYYKSGITSLTIMNFLIGTIFIMIFLFRKHISTENKLRVIITVVILTGLNVLLLGFLNGNARSLYALSCVLAIIFFSNKFSRLVVGFTTSSMYIVSGLVAFSIVKSANKPISWFTESFTFMIYMFIIYLSIRLLKKHLISGIIMLQKSSNDMKEMVTELENKYEEIKNNEETINKLAYYDQLTLLPNQYLLESHITKRITEGASAGKFVLIDIKNFRFFNSIYSSIVGDRILKLIGETMKHVSNTTVFPSRITGNEFALWFEGASEVDIVKYIREVSNKFYEGYSDLIKYKKVDFHISYSAYPSHGKNYVELYQKAVVALANARQASDKEIVAFNENLYSKILEHEKLKVMVEKAIRKNEFTIYYQNKVDTRIGNIYGVEALSRWITSDSGTISPNIFIPIIEESNLSVVFGENTIKNVLKDYVKLIEKFGEDLKISINVSPTHIMSDGFAEFIINEIRFRNIDPTKIVLEITEEVMIEGVDFVNSILKPLKDFGVKISLDDFGSGYSSLNYLSKLAPDELKIDRTFIEQLQDKRVVSLVAAIVQLKNVYGFSIVAEGVETAEQLEILKEIGCYKIQGFYFSKPEALK
jgi:diguanylate cyclase (GGDEF)-like protein